MKQWSSWKSFMLLLIVVCLVFILVFLDNSNNSWVSRSLTIAIAFWSAFMLLIQTRREKDISQAEFIVEYGRHFHGMKGNDEMLSKLERCRRGVADESIITEDDYDNIVNYLTWCEGLSVLIQEGVMDLPTIDNLYSYNFFLVTSSPYVREKELIPQSDFYRGVFFLHKQWVDYKRKTGQEIDVFVQQAGKPYKSLGEACKDFEKDYDAIAQSGEIRRRRRMCRKPCSKKA